MKSPSTLAIRHQAWKGCFKIIRPRPLELEELLGVVIENPRLNDKATLIALIEHLN